MTKPEKTSPCFTVFPGCIADYIQHHDAVSSRKSSVQISDLRSRQTQRLHWSKPEVKVSPKPVILKICQYIRTRAAAGLEQSHEHLPAFPHEIRSSGLASNFPDRLFELGSREVHMCPLCRIKLRSVLTALWNIHLRNQCAVLLITWHKRLSLHPVCASFSFTRSL